MTLNLISIEEAEEREARRCPAGWSTIADHRATAPRMLVKELLPYEGLAFIGGQSGSGKTFIAVDLSVALASQTPFFGRAVKERVGVAFIAAEGGGQIGNRLRASADARGVEVENLPIAWRGDAPLLRNASDVNAVTVQLQQMNTFIRARYGVRLGVAVLDTVAASFDFEDEDKNSEVARAIRHMR
jgi:RecA-family ATPase